MMAWAALGLFAAGCAEELGPERRVTTRVAGVVREGKRPVGGGWIEFIPMEGTVGNMRSAPIGPDGRFEAEDVPVGVNRIGFTAAPIQLPNWRNLFDPLNSVISRTVPPHPSTDFEVDLYQELGRFAAESGR